MIKDLRIMKIWILNHYAITPDMPGGSRHYDLGKELVRRGHKVTIFASPFNYTTRRDDRLKGDEDYRKEEKLLQLYSELI